MGRKRDREEERLEGREMGRKRYGRKRDGEVQRVYGRELVDRAIVYTVFHYPAISVMGKMCSYQRDNTHTHSNIPQWGTTTYGHHTYGPLKESSSQIADLKRCSHKQPTKRYILTISQEKEMFSQTAD